MSQNENPCALSMPPNHFAASRAPPPVLADNLLISPSNP